MNMSSLPYITSAGGNKNQNKALNNSNGNVVAQQIGNNQSSEYNNMTEAFEPTPINPTIIPTQQQQAQFLQNRHLLNAAAASHQLQYAVPPNNLMFNRNNLFALAVQMPPAAAALYGPVPAAMFNHNYQGVPTMVMPTYQNALHHPNGINFPGASPGSVHAAAAAAAAAALGESAQQQQASSVAGIVATAANQNNNNNNAIAMAAAAAGANSVGKNSGVTNAQSSSSSGSSQMKARSRKSGSNNTSTSKSKSQAEIGTAVDSSKEVGANLDRLTQKLQGIQEQLKKNTLIDSSRSTSLSEDAVLCLKRKTQACVKDGDCSSSDYSSDDDCCPAAVPSKKQKRSDDASSRDLNKTTKLSCRSNKKWEQMFQLLIKFSKREGHCNVYRYHEEDGMKLGMWLCRQRLYQKKGGLDPQRVFRLEKVGVVWSISHAEKMMNLMYQYKMREGNCEVPRFHVEDGMKLGMWLQDQKQQRKRNNLTKERILRLDQLGIVWDIHDDRWEKMYKIWCQYIERTGHPNVPRSYVENGNKLGMWLHTQRKFKKRGTMNDRRSALLEEAGIVWDVLKQCQKKAYTNGMYRDENGRARRKCEDI